MSTAANHVTNSPLVERIADAVLYEGYILYPYRPSAVKNQQRWNFGVVCPESYAVSQRGTESSTMRTECLVEVDSSTRIDVKVRFLHLLVREVAEIIQHCQSPIADCGHITDHGTDHFRSVPSIEVNGKTLQTWQEAVEREVAIPQVTLGEAELPRRVPFSFHASRATERIPDEVSGTTSGLMVRTQHALNGEIEISATNVALSTNSNDERANRKSAIANRQLLRLSVVIRNLTDFPDSANKSRDDALLHSFVSTHTILQVQDGAFVSLLDPPEEYSAAAVQCTNTSTYPVLVGADGDRNCVLSSPIILYDYPQIAPQSAGDLFDGTEIDEILTLRIMTLTDEEKREMRSADHFARQILERTESLPAEEMMKLHGVMKKV